MPTRRQPRPADARLVPPAGDRARRRRRRFAAVLAGLLAAASAVIGGVVTGDRVSGNANAATAPYHSPYGVAEHMWFRPGGMYFAGWTIDPSTPTKPITAYVMVDGKVAGRTLAAEPRPDVATAHPSAGPNHGFRMFVPIPEGTHRVCVKARNVFAGANVILRCQTRTLDYGPTGAIQKLQAAGGKVTVSGWTIDWDNRVAPLTVTLTVDGTSTKVVADDRNTAIQALYPKASVNHGFTITQPAAQGRHSVCVRVTNLGYGSDTTLTCTTVTLNDSPRAHVDSVTQYQGKLRVTGWAFDPDAPTSAATVLVKVDRTTQSVLARVTRTDIGARYPGTGTQHGFDVSFALPEGSHTVCVTARNVGFGSPVALPCTTAALRFTPTAATTAVTATATGARITGWATDPNTRAAISVRITLDGKPLTTVTADDKGTTHSGHNFTATAVTKSGLHTLCAVAVNASYGTRDSAPSCRAITLALRPLGRFESLSRAPGSTGLLATGWTFDPDTTSSLTVTVTVDGKPAPSFKAAAIRKDIATSYPAAGSAHGFSSVIATNDGEHTVCLTARNYGGGSDLSLGCKLVIAVHPVAPSAPGAVTAQAGYGGATVAWTPPTSDGGAPWTKYVVTASPGGQSVTVPATATSATVIGLKASTSYSFTVQAVNVAGSSVAAVSPIVKTQASPPPQTTPAPVSTSRYIRNIRGASSTDLATMRKEGMADAQANPSGHGYLVLLDIGGQDQYDGGVVLSATTRFVSYANLVKDVQAYLDGYHAGQRPSAPVTVAIGTNNDMDVTSASGRAWADKVVDPLVAYAKRYPGMTIAGANDIEPGFRATYTQTKSWLGGYLAATSAPFIFNGSADGCAWTTTNRGCNNGWTMAGLYNLAAGAAPIRTLNLPQIYNYTMADQWKYISLTGVAKGSPRINFAGTLTEWTACAQARSCGSITGKTAWSKMWSNLQSHPKLKVASLPYATDLRIDQ